MNTNYFAILVPVILLSCNNKQKAVVNTVFVDSLVTNYSPSVLAKSAKSNFEFWQQRMDSIPEDYVNGPEYAAALSSRFHLNGNIDDLLKADSLYQRSVIANRQQVPGLFRTLAYLSIQQHQFDKTDSFLKKAVHIEGQTVPNTYLDFDVIFEKGDYRRAKGLLESIKKDSSYGYLFRRSKFEHYDGTLDNAITCMLLAAEKAGGNKYLRQVALSNTADLYLHKGDIKKAADLYTESIKIDAADLHSIMGLGWIALVHDNNDSLAERVFQFVREKSNAPDAILKLEQMAEARNDTALQKKYAEEFVEKAGNSKYGNMYNKYMIDLYTGILNNPDKAVTLAEREINSRPTPQVYAWYVWSLFSNNQKDKAYEIFKGHVSAKPLEGPELYFMGKLMQGLEKGYNAQQFFKAAWKNRYDLSPSKQNDLKENLE